MTTTDHKSCTRKSSHLHAKFMKACGFEIMWDNSQVPKKKKILISLFKYSLTRKCGHCFKLSKWMILYMIKKISSQAISLGVVTYDGGSGGCLNRWLLMLATRSWGTMICHGSRPTTQGVIVFSSPWPTRCRKFPKLT